MTVLRAPIKIDITVNFMFHSFFQFSNKVEVLSFLFAFFQFYSVACRDVNYIIIIIIIIIIIYLK